MSFQSNSLPLSKCLPHTLGRHKSSREVVALPMNRGYPQDAQNHLSKVR